MTQHSMADHVHCPRTPNVIELLIQCESIPKVWEDIVNACLSVVYQQSIINGKVIGRFLFMKLVKNEKYLINFVWQFLCTYSVL